MLPDAVPVAVRQSSDSHGHGYPGWMQAAAPEIRIRKGPYPFEMLIRDPAVKNY